MISILFVCDRFEDVSATKGRMVKLLSLAGTCSPTAPTMTTNRKERNRERRAVTKVDPNPCWVTEETKTKENAQGDEKTQKGMEVVKSSGVCL